MVKFYPKVFLLFCLSLLFGKHLLAQTGTPISFSSVYNHSVIAPSYANYQNPDAYLDVNGYVFLASSATYNVPAGTTATGYLGESETFTWQAATVYNVIQLRSTEANSLTATLTTPAPYTRLYFLYNLGKTTSDLTAQTVRIVLNYTDNSSSTVLTQSVTPYNTGSLGTTSGSHVRGFSRVNAQLSNPTPAIDNSGTAYVDELKWDLTTLTTYTKLVKSITFSFPSTPSTETRLNVFAVSGIKGPTTTFTGTVYSDNTDADGANGTGTNVAAGYVSCVDNSGKLLAKTTIASNGTYTLSGVPYASTTASTNKLILTLSDPGTVGTSTLTASTLATNWVDGTTASATYKGTQTNAIISFTRTYSSTSNTITGQNFSVHQIPTAYNRTVKLSVTSSSTIALKPGAKYPMNKTDVSGDNYTTTLNDQLLDLAGVGMYTTAANNMNGTTSNTKIYLPALPADGASILYNGSAIGEKTVIPGTGSTYGNGNLQYQFTSTAGNTGANTYSFNYQILDNLNFISSNTATYTITTPFTLPVEYAQVLTGSLANKVVNLAWTTGTEINNAYFEVQRSADASTWTDIGNVNSYYSNGTGSGHSYSFTDAAPISGVNYYRLNQVDLDGTSHYGTIIQINYVYSSNSQTAIYPNPVQSELNIINIPTSATNVVIYSMSGEVISQIPVTGTSIQVAIGDLPSAVYFANILDKNGTKLKLLKFVKK